MWLASLTTAAYGLFRGAWALSVARGLWGVSWSFLRLGGLAGVLAERPPGRRGRALGLFTGVYRLGSFAGVLVGGLLADRFGFAGAALLFAGLTAVGALLSSLPPAVAGRWGAPGPSGKRDTSGGGAAHWLPATPEEWQICLSAFGLQLAVSGVVTGTIGLLVRERLGLQIALGGWVLGPSTVTGLMLGSRFVLDLLVGPLVGHLADGRGRTRILGSLAAAGLTALLGLAWTHGLVALFLLALLFFLAGTGLATVLDSWAGDTAGRAPGRFLPAYNTWQDLGAAVGPTLAYALTNRIGLSGTYTAVALAGTLTVAWLSLARRVRLGG